MLAGELQAPVNHRCGLNRISGGLGRPIPSRFQDFLAILLRVH